MSSNLDRRDFMKAVGAVGVASAAMASCQTAGRGISARLGKGAGVEIGNALRVRPALVYNIPQRREATSWRGWGGLHTEEDVNQECRRIEGELAKIKAASEFPMEFLSLVRINSDQSANSLAAAEDCDALLLYASTGARHWLIKIADSGKPVVMFLRHRSGPVSVWYEIAHPHFLREASDEYKRPHVTNDDIVVDELGDVVWRLRALYGLKNSVGTRILAIGGAGGWGIGRQLGPKTAKDIWKLDIQPVEYKELESMIVARQKDEKAWQQARDEAAAYLKQGGVSLETTEDFFVNGFLLTQIFRELMERENAPAITIGGCMTTIIPMAKTTACLTLSLINDEGAMAFCESDFVVVPSGILLRHISGKPVFLNDPTHPHHGMVTIAHCTAPRRNDGKNLDPVRMLTHFESDYGAAPKVEMKKGQVLTNLIPDFHSRKWVAARASIMSAPFYDICRSQVDIKIDGNCDQLLEDMRGFHWMTCYGDYMKECAYAVKKLGIGWESVS